MDPTCHDCKHHSRVSAMFQPDNDSPHVGRWQRIYGALKAVVIGMLVITAITMLVLALPLLLVFLAVDEAITTRRKLAALASTGCVVCGSRLHRDALDLADTVLRSERAEQSGLRFYRVVRRLHAICPACGTRYEWDGKRRRFQLLDTEPF